MTKTLLLDGLERAVRTAIQAGAAAWLVTQDVSLSGLKVAGVAVLVSIAMTLAGSRIGNDTDSGSVLDQGAVSVTLLEVCAVIVALVGLGWAFGWLPR